MAPPRRIPKDELFTKLAAMRESGHTCKEMARKLGGIYSHRYIQGLCGLLSAIHITIDIEQPADTAYKGGAKLRLAQTAAASEAKPGDSPNGDS